MSTQPIVWSFSSLKTFQQCPRKYYHTKILKDVREPDTTATLYGKSAHTAAEEYIRDGVPIPPQFEYMKAMLDQLNAIPGEKLCEVMLGLTKDLQPCEFHADDVWWHGIADLVVLDEANGIAHSVDYKTSKNARYADTKQLDYMAAAVFAKFPKLKMIKSMLLFVVSVEFVKKNHTVEKVQDYISTALPSLKRLETALETGVWNPVSGPLCGFCPVKTCEYNRS